MKQSCELQPRKLNFFISGSAEWSSRRISSKVFPLFFISPSAISRTMTGLSNEVSSLFHSPLSVTLDDGASGSPTLYASGLITVLKMEKIVLDRVILSKVVLKIKWHCTDSVVAMSGWDVSVTLISCNNHVTQQIAFYINWIAKELNTVELLLVFPSTTCKKKNAAELGMCAVRVEAEKFSDQLKLLF